MASNKKITTVGKPAATKPAVVTPAVVPVAKAAVAKRGGKKLDTSRSYGTVCGEHKAAFEQDGVLYDANGDQLGGKAHVELVEAPAGETGEGDVGAIGGEGGQEVDEDALANLGSGE